MPTAHGGTTTGNPRTSTPAASASRRATGSAMTATRSVAPTMNGAARGTDSAAFPGGPRAASGRSLATIDKSL
ncbi:MAG: hypothetical protein ACLPSW_11735 [Roseiarcus sp.]